MTPFLLPILSIGIALATPVDLLAPRQQGPLLEQKWYDFVGEDPNNPLDYEVHAGPAPTCNAGTIRCAVKATSDPWLPGDYPDLQDPSIQIRNKP